MIEAAALFAFVLLLGTFLLWSRRTVSAALVYTLLGITVAAGLVEMRSMAKPLNMEWRSPETADVLWYDLHEGTAIYLVLNMPTGPRFYVMPWDGQKAEQLLQAGRDVEGKGGTLKMQKPFERSLAPEEERLFYAVPQPALPEKVR